MYEGGNLRKAVRGIYEMFRMSLSSTGPFLMFLSVLQRRDMYFMGKRPEVKIFLHLGARGSGIS